MRSDDSLGGDVTPSIDDEAKKGMKQPLLLGFDSAHAFFRSAFDSFLLSSNRPRVPTCGARPAAGGRIFSASASETSDLAHGWGN